MEDRTPVIVGVGLSDYPVAPHLSLHGHHAQAMQRAFEHSGGLSLKDVDGYMTVGQGGLCIDDVASLHEYFDLQSTFMECTQLGGASFGGFIDHAAMAIRAGKCDTVLMTYGSDMRSNRTRFMGADNRDAEGFFEGPMGWDQCYGASIIASYALAAMRHMHEYGTTREHLAEIAVAARLHAANNPNALKRDPITIEDVLNAPRVVDPFGVLDCCVITDGGAAYIMTTKERAKDLDATPLYILGSATGMAHGWNVSQMKDFTVTSVAQTGPEAFRQAGLKPEDMDLAMVYDSFTITTALLLEDLGFCKKGEIGAFIEDGRIRPGGALPLNTDGGGLSAAHPGFRGVYCLSEAIIQLRHEAGDRQVKDCNTAVVVGSGGILSTSSTTILSREEM